MKKTAEGNEQPLNQVARKLPLGVPYRWATDPNHYVGDVWRLSLRNCYELRICIEHLLGTGWRRLAVGRGARAAESDSLLMS